MVNLYVGLHLTTSNGYLRCKKNEEYDPWSERKRTPVRERVSDPIRPCNEVVDSGELTITV